MKFRVGKTAQTRKSQKSPSSSFKPPNEEPLANRVAKLTIEDLATTLDLQLNSLCRYIPEYHRTGSPDCLGEALLATEALYVMLDALLKRRSELEKNVTPARQNQWQ